MPPEKIDSRADDVKPLGLLRQISVLAARVDELVAQNKALLARIAELEAERGKPPKTPASGLARWGCGAARLASSLSLVNWRSPCGASSKSRPGPVGRPAHAPLRNYTQSNLLRMPSD